MSTKAILKRIDFLGGFLSITGLTLLYDLRIPNIFDTHVKLTSSSASLLYKQEAIAIPGNPHTSSAPSWSA